MTRILAALETRPALGLLLIALFGAVGLLTIGSDEPTLAFVAGAGLAFTAAWLLEHV